MGKKMSFFSRRLLISEMIWFFLLMISTGMILGDWPYLFFDPSMIPRRNPTTTASFPMVFLHVIFGIMWLLSGLFQFSLDPRKKKTLHRSTGMIYVVSAVLSVLSLFVIYSKLGPTAPFGVSSFPLSVYTLVSLALGLFYMNKEDYPSHRAWMIRSLVFALVMPLSRFNSAVFEITGLYLEIWALEILTLVVAELVILHLFRRPLFRSEKRSVNLFVSLACLGVGLTVFYLTFSLEYRFVMKRIF